MAAAFFLPTPQISLLASSERFLVSFLHYLTLVCLFVQISHIPGILLTLFFSV